MNTTLSHGDHRDKVPKLYHRARAAHGTRTCGRHPAKRPVVYHYSALNQTGQVTLPVLSLHTRYNEAVLSFVVSGFQTTSAQAYVVSSAEPFFRPNIYVHVLSRASALACGGAGGSIARQKPPPVTSAWPIKPTSLPTPLWYTQTYLDAAGVKHLTFISIACLRVISRDPPR